MRPCPNNTQPLHHMKTFFCKCSLALLLFHATAAAAQEPEPADTMQYTEECGGYAPQAH